MAFIFFTSKGCEVWDLEETDILICPLWVLEQICSVMVILKLIVMLLGQLLSMSTLNCPEEVGLAHKLVECILGLKWQDLPDLVVKLML